MKKFSVHFLVLLAFVFSFNNLSARELKLGIFDSAHLDEYHYQPFIDIARSVDFNVDYVSFPKIADSSTMQDLNIDQYDGIIFVLGIEFFKNYLQFLRTFTLEQKQGNRDVLTIVSDKFLRLIEEFSIKQNKLIGFAFPPGGNPKAFAQILRAAGFRMAQIQHFPGLVEDTFVVEDSTKSPTFQKQLGEFFANTMNFLSIPLEKRSYMYNTTLMPPLSQRYPEGQQLPPQMLGALNQLRLSEQTLPLKQSSSLVNALVQTLPYSIYLYNHIRKNYIFITSSTVLSFAGIAENYFVCPDNADFRKQMLEQVQEMMWELNVILSNENLKGRYQEAIKVINENEKPLVPPVVRAMGMKKENKLFPSTYNVGNNFLRGIGWTELHHFYDKPEMNPAEAKELIENKGFDRLFIEYKKLIVETVRLIENEEFEKLVEEIKRLIVGVEGLTETKELEKLTETKEFKNLIESKELKRLRDLYAESQRDFYIECVLRSGINALWFDFDPQVYYSPIGVNKNKKKNFGKQ